MSTANTRAFDSVQIGDELPALEIPVTAQLIVGGAIATRDYFPGHHDAEAARALGSANIFMNILTTNGLVERFVEDWAGPQCELKTLKIKLGAPNYPGDTLKFSGSISERDEAARSVTVSLKGKNSMGSHVSGSVKVKLP